MSVVESIWKKELQFKFETKKKIHDMRHISHLSEVELCGRETDFPFNALKFPGSRKGRIALDRAVGWMHLDNWKNINVGNPVPYFRSALATNSPNLTTNQTLAPGQKIVETVLQAGFRNGFSATLKVSTFKQIHDAMKVELGDQLGIRPGVTKGAITPGFEDMLPATHPTNKVVPVATAAPSGTGGGAIERYALEEALGAAFIDYFNGYSVDGDLTQAFVGYGGTDVNIGSALKSVFNAGFTETLITQFNADGVEAGAVMSKLATTFSTALSNCVSTSRQPFDPVFADLLSL